MAPNREDQFIDLALSGRYNDDGQGSAPALRRSLMHSLRLISRDEMPHVQASGFLVGLMGNYRQRDVLPFEVLLAAGLLCRRYAGLHVALQMTGNLAQHLLVRILQSDPLRSALGLDAVQGVLPLPSDG